MMTFYHIYQNPIVSFYLTAILTILGDPGAVNRVEINGGESFQERERESLMGCYS